MQLIERVMRERRSVRAFRPDPPPEDVVERVLELATLAPSASNKQPWRFFVVADRARIRAMADAVREEVDAVARDVLPEAESAFRAYGDYFTRFEGAPIVIVPIHRGHTVLSHLTSAATDPVRRARIAEMERDSGLVGASLAVMNLLLAAHAHGLGASVMTGPLLAAHRLREILSVPAAWGIVALVPIGWPAEEPASPGRKPLDQVVRWVR